MKGFLVFLQFLGVITLGAIVGVVIVCAYGLILAAHRWAIDRGWLK